MVLQDDAELAATQRKPQELEAHYEAPELDRSSVRAFPYRISVAEEVETRARKTAGISAVVETTTPLWMPVATPVICCQPHVQIEW